MPILQLLLYVSILTSPGRTEECVQKQFVDASTHVASSGFGGCNQESGAGWKGKLAYYFEEDGKSLVINLITRSGDPWLVRRPECVAEMKFFVNEELVKTNIDQKTKSVKIDFSPQMCQKSSFDLKIKFYRLGSFTNPVYRICTSSGYDIFSC